MGQAVAVRVDLVLEDADDLLRVLAEVEVRLIGLQSCHRVGEVLVDVVAVDDSHVSETVAELPAAIAECLHDLERVRQVAADRVKLLLALLHAAELGVHLHLVACR